MKSPVILSILCIGLGIAIGWIVKPDPEAPSSDVAKAKTPEASNRKDPPASKPPVTESDRTTTPSVRVVGGGPQEEISEEQREEMEKYQSRFGDMMKKRRMAKLDARISKLVAQLNLTPDQEAALRKAAEENVAGIDSMMSGDFDPSQLSGLTGEGGLDDALAEILTDEQKEEHEALKKRELANKVEARALKNLAKLSNLDMTQEQKDAAYDILYKQAEETVGQESPANGIFTAVTEGFGIELDAADIGIDFGAIGAEAYEDAKNGETPDQGDIMARLKESQQKQIDKKVEALRPVLDDAQLEQYRKSLEIQQGGIFGGILGGFETGEEEGE